MLNLEGETQSYRLGLFLACTAYTLVPSLLFVPAYGLCSTPPRPG
ncbi:hypothetical protein [Caulobacter endophyticus]|nr:hypothetical protein [Caulobacter endophyticus]